MTALVAPAFQTKSKRNLFLQNDEIIEEFNTDQDASCTEETKIELSNEQNDKVNSDSDRDSSNNNDTNGMNKEEITTTVLPTIMVPDIAKVVPTTDTETSSSPKNKNAPAKGNFFSRLFGMGGRTKRKKSRKRHATKSKGVYFDTRTGDVPSESIKTIDTAILTNEVVVLNWIQSDLENHDKDVPIIVRRPAYDIYNEADDKKLLKKILSNCRKLPQALGKYASNHIMVNKERLKRNIPPLRRERHMDQIAREQAQLMAEERKLFQIDTPTDLQNRLSIHTDVDLSFQRTGMNIGRGKSVPEIHRFMMAALAERNNINDKRFFKMGMGTARAENGVLYLCQIFGGG